MTTILQHQPGQICTIFLEVLGADGYRIDPSAIPTVERIIFPSLSVAGGFPQTMTRLDTGMFQLKFTLPSLASSVGSYLVDVRWLQPITNLVQQRIYQIIVTAPFGQYSASVGT